MFNLHKHSILFKIKEKVFILWHKHLGHLSRQKIERLIKENILPHLDFADEEICEEYIRGKMTKNKIKVLVDLKYF